MRCFISIEVGIADISIWINSNILKLNKDKTQFIVLSSKQDSKKIENLHIKAVSSYINSSISVRNLGLILDHTMEMDNQVNFKYNFISPVIIK